MQFRLRTLMVVLAMAIIVFWVVGFVAASLQFTSR